MVFFCPVLDPKSWKCSKQLEHCCYCAAWMFSSRCSWPIFIVIFFSKLVFNKHHKDEKSKLYWIIRFSSVPNLFFFLYLSLFSLEYLECVGDSGCSACLKFGCCVFGRSCQTLKSADSERDYSERERLFTSFPMRKLPITCSSLMGSE